VNRLGNIKVVLVRPVYGGNVGAVCRAMKNMGLSRLALVQPRETMDYNDAQTYALHASDILDAREQFDSLPEAIKDCAIAAGTSVRDGLYRAHSKPPREIAPRLLESAETGQVALVFGSETSGLANEELQFCTHVVRIPSSPQYNSLNLAQAVMICCYELFLADASFEAPKEKHGEASVQARERMMDSWREMLQAIQFFKGDNEDHMMMGIRRIFSRGKLSEADVNILMGIARQAMWVARSRKDV
jgi:TrmH family RNA methyltransferase